MRKETRLILVVFLLVVGPAVGLSFLSARVLGNWYVVLERRQESAALITLNSAATTIGAYVRAALEGAADRVSGCLDESQERALARQSSLLVSSNRWAACLWVFRGDGTLFYPRSRSTPPGVLQLKSSADPSGSHDTRGGGFDDPESALTRAERLQHGGTNWSDAASEYMLVLRQPGLSVSLDCRARLGLAQCYRASGKLKEAVDALAQAFPSLSARTGSVAESVKASDTGEAREEEEGFRMDLLVLRELAQLSREAGDREGELLYDVALLDRVLHGWDGIVPPQRNILAAYLRDRIPHIDPAMARTGRYSPEAIALLLAEWREHERGIEVDETEATRVGAAAVQAVAEAAAAGHRWVRMRAGNRSFLCGALDRPAGSSAAAGNGLLCVETRMDVLGEELTRLAARSKGEREMVIRVRGLGAAARDAVEPYRSLGERPLPAPLESVILEVYATNPEAMEATIRLQTRLYVWSGILLAVSAAVGGWFVWREAVTEIREARERSEFAAAVSHDLRTPLSSMRMLAESLYLERIADEEKRRKFLGTILHECDRLGRLTDRALFFFRYGHGALRYRFTEGDLGVLVRETVESFSASMASGDVAVSITGTEELPPVRFDAGAIEQVLFNLMDNAVKYTRFGKPDKAGASGTARIRVDVSVHYDVRRREVEVAVRDYGVGIPREEQRRIFRAYYRGRDAGKSRAGGVGLGLAVCKHVAEAHGGRMEVESEPGKGSVFRLILRSA